MSSIENATKLIVVSCLNSLQNLFFIYLHYIIVDSSTCFNKRTWRFVLEDNYTKLSLVSKIEPNFCLLITLSWMLMF